jgi:hypothetical protein
VDTFVFRQATGFIDIPAGTHRISIAPGAGTAVTDTIVGFTVTLTANQRYVVVADGIVSITGYNPGYLSRPFDLKIYTPAQESSLSSSETDILVHHGSTDAPPVDVRYGGNVLVNNAAYGDFSSYLALPTGNYTISITDTTGATTVASYSAPLQTLGLSGAAITVVASGFLTPANNSNGPAFGLFVAPATGGNMIALPPVAVGLNSLNQIDLGLSTFPNPVKNEVNVQLNLNKSQDVLFSLYDSQGRLVAADMITLQEGENNRQISTQHLTNGLYILAVSTQEGVQTTKLQVAK